MWAEDAIYEQWLTADASSKSERMRELCQALRNHARVVVCQNLREYQPNLIDDIVRTVIMRLNTFRGESRLSTWVHRIALRNVFDEIRRRQDERARFESLPCSDPEGEEEDQRFVTEPPDLCPKVDLERLADRLPERERHLLSLRYEGLTFREIAERTGSTPEAEESRWQRLKNSLKRDGRLACEPTNQ